MAKQDRVWWLLITTLIGALAVLASCALYKQEAIAHEDFIIRLKTTTGVYGVVFLYWLVYQLDRRKK